jgi:hypothetical protein
LLALRIALLPIRVGGGLLVPDLRCTLFAIARHHRQTGNNQQHSHAAKDDRVENHA